MTLDKTVSEVKSFFDDEKFHKKMIAIHENKDLRGYLGRNLLGLYIWLKDYKESTSSYVESLGFNYLGFCYRSRDGTTEKNKNFVVVAGKLTAEVKKGELYHIRELYPQLDVEKVEKEIETEINMRFRQLRGIGPLGPGQQRE